MVSLNLKAKFAIVAGTMILAVAVIITAFLTYQQEQTIREEFIHRGVVLTENLAYSAQLPLAAENKTSLQRLAQGLFKEGEVSYVQFQTSNGTELLKAGGDLDIVEVRDVRQHPDGTRSAWIRSADGHTYLDVHTAVVVEGSNDDDILSTRQQGSSVSLGQVRLGMTAEAADRQIAHMRLLAGMLGLAIALAAPLRLSSLHRTGVPPLPGCPLLSRFRRLINREYQP